LLNVTKKASLLFKWLLTTSFYPFQEAGADNRWVKLAKLIPWD